MDFSLYGFDGLTKTYNVHPAFVHFPIALLPVTLVFYASGILFKKQPMLIAGRVCLYLGALSVLLAVVTGLIAQDTIPHNERIHHMMDTHRATGLILLGLNAVLALWSFWQQEQKPRTAGAFLFGLAIACYFTLQNGDLGSRMVYLEGAGVKPAASLLGEEDHEHTSSPGEHHHHHTHPDTNSIEDHHPEE